MTGSPDPDENYVQPLRYRLARHAPIVVWARRLGVREANLHAALSGEKRLTKLYARAQEMVESLERGEWKFFHQREGEGLTHTWRLTWTESPDEANARRLSSRVLVIDETGPRLDIPPE